MRAQREVVIKYSELAALSLIARKSATEIAQHYGITPTEVSKALTDLGIKKSRSNSQHKDYIIRLENDSQSLLDNLAPVRAVQLSPEAEVNVEAAEPVLQ